MPPQRPCTAATVHRVCVQWGARSACPVRAYYAISARAPLPHPSHSRSSPHFVPSHRPLTSSPPAQARGAAARGAGPSL